MCGTIALGLVGGLFASKLLFRRRWHGRWHHARHAWRGRPRGEAPPVDVERRVAGALAALELNERQADEARDVFAEIAEALGAGYRRWGGIDDALAAVAAEPFDRARAEDAIDLPDEPRRRAVDALEHLHNILTPEQRAKLR
jgi:hypothetical protein